MLFNLFGGAKTISSHEASENMKKDTNIVLLDVREDYEYNSGHIKGAKLLPVGQIASRIGDMKLAKETTLYVYCQSGARSTRACGMLQKMGYENIYNLGGIMNWPYEIIK